MEKKRAKIGKLIKAKRISLGLSLNQLNVAVPITVNYLSEIEKGYLNTKFTTFEKICKALKIDINYSYESIIEMIKTEPEKAKLLKFTKINYGSYNRYIKKKSIPRLSTVLKIMEFYGEEIINFK